MSEPLKKITIHPEWKDLCAELGIMETFSMFHCILNYVLYGNDIAEEEDYEDIYDWHERLVWEKIRDDIDADLESQ